MSISLPPGVKAKERHTLIRDNMAGRSVQWDRLSQTLHSYSAHQPDFQQLSNESCGPRLAVTSLPEDRAPAGDLGRKRLSMQKLKTIVLGALLTATICAGMSSSVSQLAGRYLTRGAACLGSVIWGS
jgi:hypothetical protein